MKNRLKEVNPPSVSRLVQHTVLFLKRNIFLFPDPFKSAQYVPDVVNSLPLDQRCGNHAPVARSAMKIKIQILIQFLNVHGIVQLIQGQINGIYDVRIAKLSFPSHIYHCQPGIVRNVHRQFIRLNVDDHVDRLAGLFP